MTISQTVEIPADHRLILEMEIPDDVPAGIKGLVTLTANINMSETAAMQMPASAPKGVPRPELAVKIAPWEIDERLDKETIATMLRHSVVNKNINPEIRAAANRKLCGCQAGGDGHDVERFMESKHFEREHEYVIDERQRDIKRPIICPLPMQSVSLRLSVLTLLLSPAIITNWKK